MNRAVSRLKDSQASGAAPTGPPRSASRRALALLRPHLGGALFVLAMAAVGAACTAFFAWAAGPAIQLIFQPFSATSDLLDALHGSPHAAILALAVGLLGVGLLRALASYAGSVRMLRIEEDILADLRRRLHERVLRRDLASPAPGSAVELGARIAYEVQAVRLVLSLGVAGSVNNVAVATGLAILALRLDPLLATTGLVMLPLVAASTARLSRLAREAQHHNLTTQAELAARAGEDAGHVGAIRSAGALEQREAAFLRDSTRAHAAALRSGRLMALVGPTTQLAGAVAAALALIAAALVDRDVEPQTWISLVAALLLLYRPVRGLSQTAHALSAGLASLDRIDELERMPLSSVAQGDRPLPVMQRSLRLEDVRFAWPPGSTSAVRASVLDGVSLEIAAGESVALVGESGAGKSTLLRIAAGLLAPTSGRVRIDGLDLSDVRAEDLPASVGYVGQEPALFRGSVTANIALADPQPDAQRVAEAAREAGADGFIRKLDAGYDSLLSADGLELSAGERQRLCIARALYSGAPLLILDEPTAALDAETEALLGRTIDALAEGHGLLIASHRRETIARADRVLRLEAGALEELVGDALRKALEP
ncbi:MAG: ABC transporter ATP-binding protein [Deltaproteobacteria bacterium]|nr:ABC transporter ATP-binding protein [Deltaproteobacteria bacterium]